jgi:SAM-dependent methyltransferase
MPRMPLNSIQRFSSRVGDYAKYRPSYPPAAIELLRARCGLRAGVPVADLGAGTGILTALLLEAGARVMAVEPNAEMRAAAQGQLGQRAGFVSVAGTAEATTLAADSVALALAGQAFHWFDPERARAEALRILAPGGWAALLWNELPQVLTPFTADYDALLRRYAPQYEQVLALRVRAPAIRQFFGHEPERAVFANRQVFGFEGLKGRLMSCSYAPEPGQPQHAPMLTGLREVFERHQRGGEVVFAYQTLVFFGQPGRDGA